MQRTALSGNDLGLSAQARGARTNCRGIETRPYRKAVDPDELTQYSANVHQFVALRINNSADAADIAQQTFLCATLKIDTFRGGSLRAWIYTIARRLVIDYYRCKGRYQFVDVTTADATERALRTSQQHVPDICDRSRRLHCWLRDVLRFLTIEEQIAVLMADVYGYAAKDSAAKLHISVPSYKLMLHVARAYLSIKSDEAESAEYEDHKAPVTCPLGKPELKTLRAELITGFAQVVP